METTLETHNEAIVEPPLHQDAQLVLEATFNREAPTVLEAPLVQHVLPLPQGKVESRKETEV